MKKLIILSLVLFSFSGSVFAASDARLTYSGTPSVVDGDSIYIGNTEMRLLGLDAVELHQSCKRTDGSDYPCGVLAKQAMIDTIAGRKVHCHGSAHDKYKRPLVQCFAGHVNLSHAMITQGWAVATSKATKPLEAQARAAKLGIWDGTFDLPWDWRHAHPWHPSDETKASAPPD